MSDTLTITRPDDWHLHLRDGALLGETVPATAAVFHRAVVMPNLVPPVTTVAMAHAYRQRVLAALPQGMRFEPLMTLYLTDTTSAAEVAQAAADPQMIGCKLYPAGATTNSDSGVTGLEPIRGVLAAMEEHDLPLLVHGEVTDNHVDIFDRERVFIDSKLTEIRRLHPKLRISLEHITTADGIQWVQSHATHTAGTITPQHLLFNRNDMLAGGVRPHFYCLPILKRQRHQEVIQEAVASGDKRFFLGTDSAPHARHKKENACGCAGCFSAPAALPLYAHAFAELNALDKLEGFASHYGADFYRLPRNTETVTLRAEPMTVAERIHIDGEDFTPFLAGESIPWSVASST